ncbi:MAG TPA: sulfatase [Woeseiaceae bacterium]|nr:sulfatase [Woeseiaceae bacterium]
MRIPVKPIGSLATLLAAAFAVGWTAQSGIAAGASAKAAAGAQATDTAPGAQAAVAAAGAQKTGAAPGAPPPQAASRAPQNVVFILADDHRYDFMGFMEQAPDFLETPNLDRMAAEGAHLANAFVTTALCSPSRASILTGQYAHRHRVVDNSSGIPEGTVFFPQYLQEAGYATAFIGKWHMGEADDAPRPGFDHWVSFRGQGRYVDPVLNIDGERSRFEGYTTDILTDQAIDWLERHEEEEAGEPFFLMLSHKAVHAEFVPAPRHAGHYADIEIPYPPSMANTESNYEGKPDWVRAQRYSWHGVAYAYQGALDFDEFYRGYAETLLALDESVGRVLDYLEDSGLAESTLVIYMGDNGFLLGEHGLIDKRNAYEESMRVPMLAWAPGFIEPGTTIRTLVRNIDIAPTVLDLMNVEAERVIDGHSVLPVLAGRVPDAPLATQETAVPGEPALLYEYYWEYAFPHTPTTFALRGPRYKYIFYHGIWDTAELYDLATDPHEMHNLIDVPEYQDEVATMRKALFERLEATGGMSIPLKPAGPWQAGERLLH